MNLHLTGRCQGFPPAGSCYESFASVAIALYVAFKRRSASIF